MGHYVLTGGATGIGAAIAESLRANEHHVTSIDIKEADVVVDLATCAGRMAAIEAIQSLAPDGIDGLITCAGVASHCPDHALIASVNFFGSVDLVVGLLPQLAQRKGAVILVSSNSAPQSTSEELVAALLAGDEAGACAIAEANSGHAAYSGSKLAVARWMRRNAPDFAAGGVRINAIAPGYIDTPMTQAVEADPNYRDAIQKFKASIPVSRAGTPADIAAIVDFLLQPAASFICGSVLFADGGHDALHRPDQV